MTFPNPKTLLSMALLCVATASQAVPVTMTFTVDARANSSVGGVGLPTLLLTAGQSFSVFSGINDLASAGALPRFSDANGLTGPDRFANAMDDSGQPVGTRIGVNFGLRTQGGLSAPFGALVGQINPGSFFFLGRSFSGPAPATGLLRLFYFDSNAADNTGSYRVSITTNVSSTAVPEPETYALMLAGLTVMGFVTRRQR